MISVVGLSKVYGKKAQTFRALSDVSFEIEAGKSVAVVGKSGSGKSTLMHIMSGLDHPTSGQVIVEGQDITTFGQKALDRFRAEKIGFIFQSFFVSANESCYHNVGLPLEIAGVAPSKRRQKIERALRQVDMIDKRNELAKNLSGGQKQRLAIARAIVRQPQIIFADEPTGNLDSVTGERIEKLLFEFNRKLGSTLVIVTHDVELASKCDMQIEMKDGQVVSITKAKPKRRAQTTSKRVAK